MVNHWENGDFMGLNPDFLRPGEANGRVDAVFVHGTSHIERWELRASKAEALPTWVNDRQLGPSEEKMCTQGTLSSL